MKKIAYGLVSIAGQNFGLPVNAIRTIQAYDGSPKLDDKHLLSLSGVDFIVKHLTEGRNIPPRKLIVVFNSDKHLALFVDEFQSIEIPIDLIHPVPGIMRSDTSFVHDIYYDEKLEKIVYLCEIDNFCHYLSERDVD